MNVSLARYEARLAGLLSRPHAIAFGFARHALASTLSAAGLVAGDEVILSPLTCKVVVLALLSRQFRPVYADIDPGTLNLDAAQVARLRRPATRAILFQHTYGHAGGIDAVAALARDSGLLLVEDCAQCMPLCSDAYCPGQHGMAALFSNNAGKPLSAGSGGVVVTADAALAACIRAERDRLPARRSTDEWRDGVMTWLHRHLLRPALYWWLYDLYRRLDDNYRTRSLDEEIAGEITATAHRPGRRQARRGLRALQGVMAVARQRHANCTAWQQALHAARLDTLPWADGAEPLYYYPVLVRDKHALLEQARRSRAEIIPWPVAAPIYPVESIADLAAYGYTAGACPVAEAVAARLAGLPTHGRVTPALRHRIVALLQAQASPP